MDNKKVNNSASNKAFAKITMLKMDIDKLKKDIDTRNHGLISKEEMESCLSGTKKQLEIWSYIFNLIEKDEI